MDLKSFMEKAKDAAVAAVDKAKEAGASDRGAVAAEQAEGVALAAPGQSASGVVATEQTKSIASITSAKFSELKALGSEKIQELISSFQQALPAIKMAGYELTEFEIELGITPKLIPHFRHADKSSEDIDSAREALRENKLGTLVLGGLLKAGEVHKQINVAGFYFMHVEIELGLIPSVRLQYKNDSQGVN